MANIIEFIVANRALLTTTGLAMDIIAVLYLSRETLLEIRAFMKFSRLDDLSLLLRQADSFAVNTGRFGEMPTGDDHTAATRDVIVNAAIEATILEEELKLHPVGVKSIGPILQWKILPSARKAEAEVREFFEQPDALENPQQMRVYANGMDEIISSLRGLAMQQVTRRRLRIVAVALPALAFGFLLQLIGQFPLEWFVTR